MLELRPSVLICLGLLLNACQSSPRALLYPTLQQQQIDYLCRVVYEKDFRRNAEWEQSAPEVLIVSPERVTYHFRNGQSTTISRSPEVVVPAGTYACP